MRWSYKTVHFELKKEGLLGGSFLDEAEIEEQLNQFGQSEWELISVIEVHNGIICFFRQPLTSDSTPYVEKLTDSARHYPPEDYTNDVTHSEKYQEEELDETDDTSEPGEPDDLAGLGEPEIDEYEVYEASDYDLEEDVDFEPDEDEPDSVDDVSENETDDYPYDNRIGAIRIE